MCKLKSVIIMKDKIIIKQFDSHTEILASENIADTLENAEKLFVRAELVPYDGDVFSNIDNWKFIVDQDILPFWFVRDYDETRVREAVKEWASKHVHIGKQGLVLQDGVHYVKDCVLEMCGSSVVKTMYGSSVVEAMYGSSVVKAMHDRSKAFSVESDCFDEVELSDSSLFVNYGKGLIRHARGLSTATTSVC